MGGRGASSGISDKGKTYGTEYTTLLQEGNVKFVRYNDGAASAPMETMTRNRTYAIVNDKNELRSIVFFDKENKRYKQIDIAGKPHKVEGKWILPHTHLGYVHDEKGTYAVSEKDKRLIDKIVKTWYNHIGRK